MKAKVLLAAVAFVSCGMAMAQESRFSAGLELGLPMGDFSDTQNFGFGISLGYEIPIGDNLGVMAQAGYILFSGKDIEIDLGPLGSTTIEGTTIGAIPIQAGLKYYFLDNQEGFYAGALVGIHLLSAEGADSRTNFSLAPLVGYMVGEHIDLTLRYQMMFDSYEQIDITTGTSETVSVNNSYLGIRAAYMFGMR